ncbi:MAG: protein phosphatase 2C domain-containing protein, partial [Paraglaciecola sp.]|uniref:PP2C family protein-serine/threonine phosphatase n=1 Tax=Paraglaciecola sp. TaxID=1920173 RepID=UPI003298667D
MSRMFVFSASDIGSRKTQQDDYYVCESSDNKNVIGIVADGMGGAVAGHVASQEVVSVVKQILNGRSAVEVDLLVSIVNKANARIKELGIK